VAFAGHILRLWSNQQEEKEEETSQTRWQSVDVVVQPLLLISLVTTNSHLLTTDLLGNTWEVVYPECPRFIGHGQQLCAMGSMA